jgi:hypothetical protein
MPRTSLVRTVWFTLGLSISTLLSVSAQAEPAAAEVRVALAEAEKAYQDVDYGAVYAAATRGLAAGRATTAETARLNALAGIAAAQLGQQEAARNHFLAALAIQPTLDLAQGLSPRIRGSYMEALGFWGTHPERLSLRVSPNARVTRLTYHIVDPAQLGNQIRIFVRIRGAAEFSAQSRAASPRGYIDLTPDAATRGFEYFAEVVDEHDNRLVETGNEDEPLTQQGHSQSSPRPRLAPTQPSQLEPEHPRSIILPLSLLVGGVSVAAIGVYFNVRREKAAARWNGSSCELPGKSRLEQCGNVDSERIAMERLAIGAYAAGGLLAAVGTTILFVGSRSESTRSQSPTHARWSCGAYVAVPSIVCQGEF